MFLLNGSSLALRHFNQDFHVGSQAGIDYTSPPSPLKPFLPAPIKQEKHFDIEAGRSV
jgi:hypothetical protein